MHARHQGLSGGGIIIAVVAVVIIGAGAAYMLSDVWRTKAKGAYKQFAEWTPENIAADPQGYLDFAEEKAKGALQDLKAADIRVNQQIGKLKAQKQESQGAIDAGDNALTELVGLYKAANEVGEGAWPIEWKGEERDQKWTQRQIVRLNREVESKKKLMKHVEAGLKKLETQQIRITEHRDRANEQLEQIATNRGILEVQAISDDLKETLVDMNAMLQTTVAVAGESTSDTFSLSDLAAEAETEVTDAELEAILNR